MLRIKVNEIWREVSVGTTLFLLRDAVRPNADVVVRKSQFGPALGPGSSQDAAEVLRIE